MPRTADCKHLKEGKKHTSLGSGFCERSGLIIDTKIYSTTRAEETNLTCASYTGVSVFDSTGKKKVMCPLMRKVGLTSVGIETGLFSRGLQN